MYKDDRQIIVDSKPGKSELVPAMTSHSATPLRHQSQQGDGRQSSLTIGRLTGRGAISNEVLIASAHAGQHADLRGQPPASLHTPEPSEGPPAWAPARLSGVVGHARATRL